MEEVNYVAPELMQERYKKLHYLAVFGGLPPAEIRRILEELLEKYDDDLDKARAARDLAKLEFTEGNPIWKSYLETSGNLLHDQLDGSGSDRECDVLRELGATFGTSGHLEFMTALESSNSAGYHGASEYFKASKRYLKDAAVDAVLPDQYEINFASTHALTERYGSGRRKAVRKLGRAALISPLSESTFARHRAELTLWERLKRRACSVGRTAFAGAILAAPKSTIENDFVRKTIVKLMI